MIYITDIIFYAAVDVIYIYMMQHDDDDEDSMMYSHSIPSNSSVGGTKLANTTCIIYGRIKEHILKKWEILQKLASSEKQTHGPHFPFHIVYMEDICIHICVCVQDSSPTILIHWFADACVRCIISNMKSINSTTSDKGVKNCHVDDLMIYMIDI